MTSPNTKTAEKTPQKKPAQVVATAAAAGPSSSTAANEGSNMLPPTDAQRYRSCGLFSWMKVFRYADLLMRQGC